jgi:hypothetical protein
MKTECSICHQPMETTSDLFAEVFGVSAPINAEVCDTCYSARHLLRAEEHAARLAAANDEEMQATY